MTGDDTTMFRDACAAVAAGRSAVEEARAIVDELTEEEKLWCLDGDAPTWAGLKFLQSGGYHFAPFHAARVERVGLPGLSFSDGPRGVVIGNATCFPVSMARGATWDPDLEERIGDAIGRELRASGANLTGAVCVNLLRHPAWGRAQETYGEDPFHVGEMGAALTRGLQRHVMACVKHFAVNSMENARFRVDVEVDEVALHEVYLPHFRRIVDEGVASVMSAYNQLNGTYCGDSRELLTEILRDEWGFEGYVISDWIFGMRDAARSVRAGLDVEMPYRMVRASHLAEQLAAGEVTWDDVDACVERVVATLLRFDGVLSTPAPSRDEIGAPGHVALAREAAARSVVILRNEAVDGAPVLPLSHDGATIAVFGELADRVNLGDGGSSDVYSLENVTVLAGLRDATTATVTHHTAAEATAASDADVAIVVVGYTAEHEGEYIGDTGIDLSHLFPESDDPALVAAFEAEIEALPATIKPPHVPDRRDFAFSRGGDRESVRLLDDDVALIRAVAAANPRTVVVIQAGSAVVVSDWDHEVAAVAQMFYGGQETGNGLADVLFGRENPSARLPFTVPVDEADLPAFERDADRFTYDRWHGWWRARQHDLTPAYPFGFGLSYTTFDVREVAITLAGDEIVATGSISNSGDRAGADVVQVYADLPGDDAPSRLIGFRRVVVEADDSASFEIRAPLDLLRRRNPESHTWEAAVGDHTVSVARHVGDPAAHHETFTLG